MLLTLDDSERRERYLNASKTLLTLLGYGAVPVINENDTVATQELRYGDNDRLAARVAQMVSAECLVLLSDVDGLYTADPRRDQNARYVDEVTELTREIYDMAGGPGSTSRLGRHAHEARGGAHRRRCRLSHVHRDRPRRAADQRPAAGGKATWFLPSATPGAARKQWIAGTLKPQGRAARRRRRRARARRAGAACCRPASQPSTGRSAAAMPSASWRPDGRELGRGLMRLSGRRSGADRRPAFRRDPGDLGLQRRR